MSYRLFLSYSAQWPDDAARQAAFDRLEALAAAITEVAAEAGGDVRVTYDRQPEQPGIRPGDDWRQRIAFMLCECQAAVIVLDEAALRSKWVLAEATFLSLRRLADPDGFRLVPVSYLDQPDFEQAKAARALERQFLRETVWDVVAMEAIQFVRAMTPREVAAQVVTALLAAGGLVAQLTPLERLADLVASMIRASAGPLAAGRIADELEVEDTFGGRDEYGRLAVGLTREALQTRRLAAVRERLRLLGPNSLNELRREVLELLAPLPYDPDAAAVLGLRRPGGGYVHASVATIDPEYSLPRYLDLPHLAGGWGGIRVENLDGSEASICAALRAEWRSANPRLRRADDAAVDERLAQADSYVMIPGPLPERVLRALELRYPRLAFVVHHDPAEHPPLPEGVRPVLPQLDAATEEAILLDYDTALANLT